MTAPSPDDLPGLVEVVAEAIADAENDVMEKSDPTWEHTLATSAGDWIIPARAAVAAMVEHLGLVEQFGTDEHCDDHEWADEFVDEASARRAADADPYLTVVRRFASRWTEAEP